MSRLIAVIIASFFFTGLASANGDSTRESNNDLTVFANDISPLLGHLKLNATDYATVKTVGSQGYYEFDLQSGVHVKAWLITADSTLSPYVAVCRKEYLDEAKKELHALKGVVISDDRGKVHIRDVAGYNKTIRMIDSILHNSTARELAKPAIVSVDASHFQGFEDGQTNATTLVRMNPNYFNGNADQAPKCLLVCWRYNPSETLASGIDRQLSENFDGQKFQALLAK